MNGRRRFLVGTVLSIQSSSFMYPACQSCCSRLTRTSCRYECHKCGTAYKDAAHRYKLCVKVSEEQRLRVITIFGKCLEQIFGGSADSLHSHLQVSSQLSGDLEQDKAQELLFQAAEHCLIGRSFVFAVKIPENFDSNVSRNIVACQIILLHEDPTGCTVLSYFNRLLESALSNDPIHTKTDVSTDTTNLDLSDLGFSEGNGSLHQSWNHYADYWQQSLGLVSSPQSGTSAESQCSNYRRGECSGAEPAPTSTSTMVCSQRKLNVTDTASHPSSRGSIGSPRVKYSSPAHIHTNTHSPPSSAPFHRFSSKPKMALGQESYLQNVCKSGSRKSQSRAQLPPQTAEIHQAKEEIWEDFPFSESLSEFIANIEDNEDIRPSTSTEEKLLKERLRDPMNVPVAQSSRNLRVAKDASHCSFDKRPNDESSSCIFNHLCETVGSYDTGLADRSFPSMDLTLGRFHESSEKSGRSDVIASRQSPTKALSSGTYSDDGLDLCSFREDLDRSAISWERGTSSRRKKAEDEPKSSDGDRAEGSGKLRRSMTEDDYNASADLFEVSNNPEDEGTSQSQRVGSPTRGQGRWQVSSPRTDVLPYRHRNPLISDGSLSENHETCKNLTTEDLVPYLQSTPVLRRVPGTGRLTVDPWPFNVAFTSSTVSARTKSRSTLRHILLKNMKQQHSAMLYGLSENCSLRSPNLSPFSNSERSTALIPNKRIMLAHKARKKGAILESFDNQTCHNNDVLTRTDCRTTGREDSMEHGSDTLDDVENLSPENRSLQEGDGRLCPVQEQRLTSDWSPELFSGKSDVSQPSDCLQRRLF